ncbi:hypothetical protein [uncultured Methanobrevibacter sp.]|uniref:hypothetical protein n=1 Tax=uncultured Methanobrevibacter sp. TaxID=253161 RepID=UPI0026205AA2|nr:hypothetical protein [uncultured Methanobrevibacter sp.]
MIKKEHILILILLIVILAFSIAIVNVNHKEAKSNINTTDNEVLANNSKGSVSVIRHIGNPDGKRIAYVVGLHPLENQTHRTLVNLLPTLTDLNCCYDIYIVNVTSDIGYYGDGSSDDSPGRQNGQNLAYEYVYPQIVDGNYELAVDVHSNVGAYPYQTFVFSPVKEGLGVDYAHEVSDEAVNISYYAPDSTTSGPYLTIPLNENGVPAFYYEEYSFAPQDVKDSHMLELIYAVDGLEF